MLLEKTNYEFLKLNLDDLSIIAWIYERHPNALHSFLEGFINNEYASKGIELNVEKLYHEVADLCDGKIKDE